MKKLVFILSALLALGGAAFGQSMMSLGVGFQNSTFEFTGEDIAFPALGLQFDGIMGDPICFFSSITASIPNTIKWLDSNDQDTLDQTFSTRLAMDLVMGLGYRFHFSRLTVFAGLGVSMNSMQLLPIDYMVDSISSIRGGVGAVVDVGYALSPALQLVGGARYIHSLMDVMEPYPTFAPLGATVFTPYLALRITTR